MPYGGGLIGADQALHLRALAGFGRHPNVGAVLLIGSETQRVLLQATVPVLVVR
jgi:nucleotide-binding universal stress UspA family protein